MLIATAVVSLLSMQMVLSDRPEIYPVSLEDAVLQDEDTYISDTARSFMSANESGKLHCFEMPDGTSDYDRVCMTTAEWQLVFDRIALQQSINRRERAVGLAEFYLSSSGNR